MYGGSAYPRFISTSQMRWPAQVHWRIRHQEPFLPSQQEVQQGRNGSVRLQYGALVCSFGYHIDGCPNQRAERPRDIKPICHLVSPLSCCSIVSGKCPPSAVSITQFFQPLRIVNTIRQQPCPRLDPAQEPEQAPSHHDKSGTGSLRSACVSWIASSGSSTDRRTAVTIEPGNVSFAFAIAG